MDSSASLVQPHRNLGQHTSSNGFHPATRQVPTDLSIPPSDHPCPPAQAVAEPTDAREEKKGSTTPRMDFEPRSSVVELNTSVSPEPPTTITLPIASNATTVTTVPSNNGVRSRARPSAIPRLLNSQISSTSHILQQPNSNNSASSHQSAPISEVFNEKSYETPITQKQMSSSTTDHQLALQSDPSHSPDPVDATQHARFYHSNGRSRNASRPSNGYRLDRTASEHPQRTIDNESETSSAFSSSGPPRQITSKINSLKNVHHKPGGGKVSIVNEKVDLGPITSKCQSFANVKHKPGGGNVVIRDEKLDLSGVGSKISSLKNVKHVPGGGQTQILSEKLEFDKTAKSKVGSLKNAQHQPGGGDVQIFREQLPWLKYNKPNLPPEERARINKQRSASDMSSSIHSGSTGK